MLSEHVAVQRQRCYSGGAGVSEKGCDCGVRWWRAYNRGNDTLRMERVSAATEHARTKYATELYLSDFIRRT